VKKNDLLLIGKIVGTHGLKGYVKVYSYAESSSVFRTDSLILVRSTKGREKTYTIKWAKPHKQITLMSLKGITSLSLAETLVGSELFIEEMNLPELEEGSYYWYDIIGISVFTTDDQYIGRVKSIIPTGSNDVLVVKDPNRDKDNEVLIPALESVVLEIDLKDKTMRVNLPEGL